MGGNDLSRRGFLAGAAAAATAWVWDALPAQAAERLAGNSLSIATTAVFPTPEPWLPGPGEVDPNVKLRAVQLLEAIGTWTTGHTGVTAAKNRVAALNLAPALVDSARTLLAPTPQAVTHVVDAQYGGILASSASVLVVLEQWLQRSNGTVVHRGTTVDVRLAGAHPKWQVTALHPARPGSATSISAAARSVLANPRIRLPFAARADVHSGAIHDSVLHCLTTLSREHVLNVSVMKSGHPIYVFGTSRHSDHPRGRAVDIWAIDGYPVVRPAHRALVLSVMRRASELGPWQVGGPVDLDGAGLKFFSDRTHQDHIHLGFSS